MTDIGGGKDKYIVVYDKHGGAPYQMDVTVDSNGKLDTGDLLAVGGLQSTTSGVTDAANKRLMTDAQEASLDALAAEEATLLDLATAVGAPVLLAAGVAVNLNAAGEQTLYTVPVGATCVITGLVLRDASVSLDTWSGSVGFNAGTDDDVVADAQHTELTGATLYTLITPKVGAKQGAAAAVLALKNNILQGAPATAKVDVIGYLY